MASDSLKELTDQVKADLETVHQQISGMEDQIASANTPELIAGLQAPPLAELMERQSDLQTILDDLVKLGQDIQTAEGNGWPDPQSFTLSDELMVQFVAQNRNLAVAAGLFKPPQPSSSAERINVSMSSPHDEAPSRSRRS